MIKNCLEGSQVVPESEWIKYKGVSGVYAVRHTESGRYYVGSSASVGGIYERWAGHRRNLNAGRHCNKKLQNAWNKYGKSAFEFLLVELTAREHATLVEQVWLDWTQAVDKGYNICGVAGSILGVKRSESTKAKISASKTGKRHTDDAKAKMCVANKGRKTSPETKAKLAVAGKGRVFSAESRKRIASALRGKKLTKAHVENLSAARRGKRLSPEHARNIGAALLGKPMSELQRKASVDAQRARFSMTEDIARKIKERYVSRCPVNGGKALAKEFGVSNAVVSNIVHGKRWA